MAERYRFTQPARIASQSDAGGPFQPYNSHPHIFPGRVPSSSFIVPTRLYQTSETVHHVA